MVPKEKINMEIGKYLLNYFPVREIFRVQVQMAGVWGFLNFFLVLAVAFVKMWVVQCRFTLIRIHHKTLQKSLTVAGSCE